MLIKPVTPDTVVDIKLAHIPDFVIEAANRLIGRNWNDSQSRFSKDSLVAEFLILRSKTDYGNWPHAKFMDIVTDNGWLNIEPIYRNCGWKVSYNDGYYRFEKKNS